MSPVHFTKLEKVSPVQTPELTHESVLSRGQLPRSHDLSAMSAGEGGWEEGTGTKKVKGFSKRGAG